MQNVYIGDNTFLIPVYSPTIFVWVYGLFFKLHCYHADISFKLQKNQITFSSYSYIATHTYITYTDVIHLVIGIIVQTKHILILFVAVCHNMYWNASASTIWSMQTIEKRRKWNCARYSFSLFIVHIHIYMIVYLYINLLLFFLFSEAAILLLWCDQRTKKRY